MLLRASASALRGPASASAAAAALARRAASGAAGARYIVPPEAIAAFHRDGYVTLPKFLNDAEIRPIEEVYDELMSGKGGLAAAMRKDYCDMSQGFDVKPDAFRIVNAMLPRIYRPALQGSVYEKRASDVVHQLYAGKFGIDYDQLLDKKPRNPKAVFAWHQDMGYWPPPAYTPDTRTATFSLALDATTAANGALKFVPGSHKAKVIRPHVPIGKSRDDAHAIAIDFDEAAEKIVMATLARGDVSIHDEYVVHGSAGNLTDGHRRTYVLAFRTVETIALERKAGFTHSHNDETNWDTFHKLVEKGQGKMA